MRRQKKTFQQRVVLYGRALPLMLFLLLGSWVVSLYVEPSVPAGGGSLLQEMLTGLLPGERRLQLGAGLLLYVGIGFLLIPLNTQLVFIRARASAQTTFFFFWLALLPFLHASLYALCPLFFFLLSLFCLTAAYQDPRPMSLVYHALLCLGLAVCFAPELLLLLPAYAVGAGLFRICTWRNLLAGVLGLLFAAVLFTAVAWSLGEPLLLFGQFDRFFAQVLLPCSGRPWWALGLVCYQALLLLATLLTYWLKRPKTGVRAHDFLNFFFLVELLLLAGMGLRPEFLPVLLPLSLVCLSFVEGYFFTSVYTKGTNVLFALGLFVPVVLYFAFLL